MVEAFAGSNSYTLLKLFLDTMYAFMAMGKLIKAIKHIYGKALKATNNIIKRYVASNKMWYKITAFLLPSKTTNVFFPTCLSPS